MEKTDPIVEAICAHQKQEIKSLKSQKAALLAACKQSLEAYRQLYDDWHNGEITELEQAIENPDYWPLQSLRSAIKVGEGV